MKPNERTIILFGNDPSGDNSVTGRDSQYIVILLLAKGLKPAGIVYEGNRLIFYFKKSDIEIDGPFLGDESCTYNSFVLATNEWRARLAEAKQRMREAKYGKSI